MSYGFKAIISGIFAVVAYAIQLTVGPEEPGTWVFFLVVYGVALYQVVINVARRNRERRLKSSPPPPPGGSPT